MAHQCSTAHDTQPTQVRHFAHAHAERDEKQHPDHPQSPPDGGCQRMRGGFRARVWLAWWRGCSSIGFYAVPCPTAVRLQACMQATRFLPTCRHRDRAASRRQRRSRRERLFAPHASTSTGTLPKTATARCNNSGNDCPATKRAESGCSRPGSVRCARSGAHTHQPPCCQCGPREQHSQQPDLATVAAR